MNDELKDLLSGAELEVRCDWCGGSGGSVHGRGEWSDCGKCHGSGYMPTEAGEKILKLLRHNVLAMIDDAKESAENRRISG